MENRSEDTLYLETPTYEDSDLNQEEIDYLISEVAEDLWVIFKQHEVDNIDNSKDKNFMFLSNIITKLHEQAIIKNDEKKSNNKLS